MITLSHARISLALHTLREAEGPPLLLLHALAGSASEWDAVPWWGPVYALDLCGHGHSGWLYGGAYCPELWAADADVALARIGHGATVVGSGVGAYVALMLAGARPEAVDAAVLLDGAGLAGAGAMPDFEHFELASYRVARVRAAIADAAATDPAVYASEKIVRPPDYAAAFAQSAKRVVLVEDGAARPPWWEALRAIDRVDACRGELSDALPANSAPEKLRPTHSKLLDMMLDRVPSDCCHRAIASPLLEVATHGIVAPCASSWLMRVGLLQPPRGA
jgi:pimeloyl-ACP methyl ester carboxylesterase